MSFSEMAVLFVLALLLFGPKKLPAIARQVGKILAEFRRASNEFKSQIESEISQLEFQERQQAKEKEEQQKILPPVAPPAESVSAPRPSSSAPAEAPADFTQGVASNESDTVTASNPTNA
jgi:sec-independent protein translocase protein TatB